MNLILDLSNIAEDLRLPFCNYVLDIIKQEILNKYNEQKTINLENYINENNIIKWQYNKDQYIKVLDIYRLLIDHFIIKKLTRTKFEIKIDENTNIPLSYSRLYDIIRLCELGTLSVRKYPLLSDILDFISKNINTLYSKFRIEEK